MKKHDKLEKKTTRVKKPNEEEILAREEKVADTVQESLERIYRTETGELPNFSRFERVAGSRWLRLVLGIGIFILALSLIAWTGLFAVKPFSLPSPVGLSVEIQVPDAVTLGKEEEITIQWENESLQPLAAADLRVSLPPEFRLLSSDPSPTDPRLLRWDLGLLASRASGAIRLKGQFLGGLGEEGMTQVVGNFRQQNTDRDRQVVVSRATKYQATVLEGTILLPETVLPGDAVVMQYSLKNQSTKSLEGLVARVAIPDGFLPTASTTMDVETRTLEFKIGTLPSQSLTTIQLPGRFAPGVGGDATFVVQAGQKQNDQFFPIQKGEKRLAVLAGELSLQLVANGSSASELKVTPGELVRVSLAYKNTSPEVLQNVVLGWGIESLLDGKPATPATLLSLQELLSTPVSTSTTKPRLLTLQYTKKEIPALASLAPGAEGTIELVFPTLLPKKGMRTAALRLTMQSEIGSIGTAKLNRKVSLTPLLIQYASDADLAVETRYYTEEGAPLGSGPLPPVVGKTTSYRLFWHLQKQLHPLEDLEVTARLPRTVTWTQKSMSDAGTLAYDAASREVRWRVKTIPDDVSELTASFEVQLTPEPIDVGRFAVLLEETAFRARDPVVTEWVSRRKPAQTTDLQQDEGAKAKGVVRKE